MSTTIPLPSQVRTVAFVHPQRPIVLICVFVCDSELHRHGHRFVAMDDVAALAAHSNVPVTPHHRPAVLHHRHHPLCL